MIKVRSFCRLHVALLDLGNATFRRYGGCGFCVSALPVEIEAEARTTPKLTGVALAEVRNRAELEGALHRLRARFPKANTYLRIAAMPPQHVGLGSKTALILAALKAVDCVHRLGIADRELQLLSGRGGTSGIGINTFFKGGFLTDSGHKSGAPAAFAPSSRRTRFELPHEVCRLPIPPNWRFYLALPRGTRTSGQAEAEFFLKHTPVAKRDVLESLALVYHGIVPAIQARDLSLLRTCLAKIHSLGFKRSEVENQPENVRRLIAITNESGLATGMSSMGPLVYAIATEKASDRFQAICHQQGAKFLGCFTGQNGSFEVVD